MDSNPNSPNQNRNPEPSRPGQGTPGNPEPSRPGGAGTPNRPTLKITPPVVLTGSPTRGALVFAMSAAAIFLLVLVIAVALPHKKASIATTTNSPSPAPQVSTGASPSVPPSVSTGDAQLYLAPPSSTLTKGGALIITIRENSKDSKVNAVQANLTYNATQLQFVSIDDGTAFPLKAESTGGSGTVKIARSTNGGAPPVTGDQEVAKVTFKVLGSGTTTPVQFGAGTAIVSSVTNRNVMGSSPGGSYTIK